MQIFRPAPGWFTRSRAQLAKILDRGKERLKDEQNENGTKCK